MMTAYSLQTLYSRTLDDEKLGNLQNLFQRTLEIPNAELDHIVSELEALRRANNTDMARIKGLYKYLDKSSTSRSQLRYSSSAFFLRELPVAIG